MKKLFLAIATVAMVFATSCKNENINEPVNGEDIPENSFICEIDPTANPQNAPSVNGGMSTKAHFNGNDVMWQVGDAITVEGTEGTSNFNCNASPTNKAVFSGNVTLTGPYTAVYPSSLSYDGANLTLPNEIDYDATRTAAYLPMYAESSTTTLKFKNVCAALKITVPTACAKIKLYAEQAIAGSATIDFTNNDTTLVMAGQNTYNYLTINGGTNGFAQNDIVYVALPKGDYQKFSIALFDADGNIFYKTPDKHIKVNVNFVYPVNITVEQNLLPGLFSVDDNTTVRFAKGNLWCACDRSNSSYTYHLENTQIGCRTYTAFGNYTYWSNPTNNGHFHWLGDDYNVNYTGNTSSSSGDSYFTSSTGIITKTIDGTTNLRALKNAEWNYLLNSRGSDMYKVGITVTDNSGNNAVANCLIIAPDGFSTSSWKTGNTYTLNELFEYNLVCLPPVGYGYFNFIQGKTIGYYNTTGTDHAQVVSFNGTTVAIVNGVTADGPLISADEPINAATPVRLVKVVTNN